MLDSARLCATLGAPELGRLVDALQRRMELGRRLTGPLTLAAVSAAERLAVDQMVGRKTTHGDSLQIDLGELSQVLRDAEICDDLESAVTSLRGRVINRSALSAQSAEAWAALRTAARADFANWPALQPWLDKLSASGILRRLAGDDAAVGATLLRELALVLANLPAHAEPLPAFAARLFGNAHALDPGVPRATLAVRAAARWAALKFEHDAEGRRSAWAGAGVMCDELSTPVLLFNLQISGDTPLAQILRGAQFGAEPVHLSLRMLLRWPIGQDQTLAGRDIYICENPTIVALAASRLGRRCAPLICVNGQFATPALILLRQLSGAQARLHYHGDFDLSGLQIARRVMAESGASPWRFGAADYLSAPKGDAFVGEVPATPWDAGLREVMRAEARIVHEEAVFEALAGELLGAKATELPTADK